MKKENKSKEEQASSETVKKVWEKPEIKSLMNSDTRSGSKNNAFAEVLYYYKTPS